MFATDGAVLVEFHARSVKFWERYSIVTGRPYPEELLLRTVPILEFIHATVGLVKSSSSITNLVQPLARFVGMRRNLILVILHSS